MEELEQKFQKQKAVYDQLVADALTNSDSNAITSIAAAKKAMSDTLSEMLELSESTNRNDQQEELIRRIMEIQRDYNGLLVSTDKLETLRKIRQFQDSRADVNLKIYGLGFLIASLALVILLSRTRE
jgi:hypothetical protein